MMNIVTLTTDFGIKDYYAAALKGRVLSQAIPLLVVDISHDIEPYNIVQGAFMLRNAYKAFPKGTIHLLSINNFYEPKPRFLVVLKDEHYFIAADNGIFSLIFDEGEKPDAIYELPPLSDYSFEQIQQLWAEAIGHILVGKAPETLGKACADYLQRLALRPIIGKDYIRGAVLHIDNYDNLILNIDRPLFDRVAKGRAFELYFKRFDPIVQLSSNYADVPLGDLLCLFNASGLLEIAVNAGKAASLFGLRIGDTIQLDFLD